MPDFQYSSITDERDARELADVIRLAFNFSGPRSDRFFEIIPESTMRLIRADGDIVGGLIIHELGQYFGGQRIDMGGIATVAIHPTARGCGAATVLMNEAMRELHRTGAAPISSLFPATQVLYRRSGFERAGATWRTSLNVPRINVRERHVTVRTTQPDDEPAIRALQQADAADHNGHLDRNAYLWDRLVQPGGEAADAYVVEEDGIVTGYLYLRREDAAGHDMILVVTDIMASTPAAGRALLGLIASHGSVCDIARLRRGPSDPLFALLPEQTYTVELGDHWMTRIVNVETALAARGYPAGVSLSLDFDITDDVIPANTGAYTLHLNDGVGHVERGGAGTIKLGIHGLATLFAGHQSLADICRAGLGAAPRNVYARADAAFPTVRPWMPDGF
ncbi:MAG: GNAT family N-acetyltransferase [Planctomycetota bacterium]